MITIIIGTNRKDSVSAQIALYYQKLLTERGQESQLLDLHELPTDFAFSALYEHSGKNETFNRFRHVIEDCDKFVFIVPEYNYSFPGVLKTFIDGLKYPDSFTDKKCCMVGVSSGINGAAIALSHLTDIFHYMGMHVLAQKPKLARINAHWKKGELTNELYNELLNQQIDKFLSF